MTKGDQRVSKHRDRCWCLKRINTKHSFGKEIFHCCALRIILRNENCLSVCPCCGFQQYGAERHASFGFSSKQSWRDQQLRH